MESDAFASKHAVKPRQMQPRGSSRCHTAMKAQQAVGKAAQSKQPGCRLAQQGEYVCTQSVASGVPEASKQLCKWLYTTNSACYVHNAALCAECCVVVLAIQNLTTLSGVEHLTTLPHKASFQGASASARNKSVSNNVSCHTVQV